MKALTLSLVMVLSTSLMARTINLATITSDAKPGVMDLQLITNDLGEAKTVRLAERPEKGRKPTVITKSASLLEQKKKIVLLKEGSHEVVAIKGIDFLVDRGGKVDLIYLSNGITGSKRSVTNNDGKDIELTAESDSWGLFVNGKKITKVHVKGKKVFGKTIGVKQIQFK